MKQVRWLVVMLALLSAPTAWGEELIVDHNGREEKVTYDYYVPPHKEGERLGVLICTGGLPMDGNKYLRSDTRECFGEEWKKFADKNRLLILGLGFLFIPEDWSKQESYQYAQAWSGEALDHIISRLERKYLLNIYELYLYGISAGAQFSVRYAQLRPESVAAVAAHAAGGFDEPQEYIPTRFLLTVGKLDNADIRRLDMGREFVRLCREKGIDIRLKVVPGIGHRQTEPQNILSRQFFQKDIKERRAHP
jgi:pimeloyl-ACP methyl ester carboxylesterase